MKRFRFSKDGKEISVGVVSDIFSARLDDPASENTASASSVETLVSTVTAEAFYIDAFTGNENIQRHDAGSVGVGLDLDDSSVDIDLDLDVGDGRRYRIDRYVAQILPEDIVRRFNILPIRIEGDKLQVLTTEPLNLPGMDQVKLMTGLKVSPIIVSEGELSRAIGEQFSSKRTSKQAIIDMTFQEVEIAQRTDQVVLPELAEAPVVNLVNSIIREAIKDKASDIHLEPQSSDMQVRYRINGLLHDITVVPRNIEPSVVARIKLLADMDITERRRSQDGHMSVNVGGRRIDLRVSTVLTVDGEKIVIRVLDKDTMLVDMDHLGMLHEQQKVFESFMSQPYGMVLVTGPTGSGKTTTLYAALQQLDPFAQNIVTVENPVEYQIPRINQISVNPYIDMTFATALRTIVRQDPDVIMVGEIRDFDTADIAVNAALTGHLVLSTLHTNDAPSALVRLLDMGIEPFLISSVVIGVVAQRLVRVICSECKESYRPSREEMKMLALSNEDSVAAARGKAWGSPSIVKGRPELYANQVKLTRGKGCDVCHNTGYSGRTGLFETFEIDEDIRKLILTKASSGEVRKAALAKGMKPLSEMGREKLLQGITTTEEIRRVIYTSID